MIKKITFAFMAIPILLEQRCENACELCANAKENLQTYLVPPKIELKLENQVALCETCFKKINENDFTDSNYWRCLTGSIWSETPSVQVLSYKILQKISSEEWSQETLDSVFLDDETMEWANNGVVKNTSELVHRDSNGTILESGDNVLLIQNLNVKGTNFIAPKGTKVPKIRLVHDNDEHIEGKINGSTIVILTKYVKKI